jgi:hypothetical protein
MNNDSNNPGIDKMVMKFEPTGVTKIIPISTFWLDFKKVIVIYTSTTLLIRT